MGEIFEVFMLLGKLQSLSMSVVGEVEAEYIGQKEMGLIILVRRVSTDGVSEANTTYPNGEAEE